MTKGAVASGHHLTTEAALEVLRAGGNAFDAAIAGLWMSCVAEPVLSSPGGGGFLLSHRADTQDDLIFDFFTDTPRERRHQEDTLVPVHADFGTTTQEFHIGAASIATPGFIAGLYAVHDRLGSIPMARLMEPAIHAAREGVTLNAFQAYLFDVVSPIFLHTKSSRDIFAQACGSQMKAEGETYHLSRMADFLEELGRVGPNFFYKGDGGQCLLNLCQDEFGHLTREDLETYEVALREPHTCTYRSNRIVTNCLPSAGGPLIGFALDLLEKTNPADRHNDIWKHVATLNSAQQAVSDIRHRLEREDHKTLADLFDEEHRALARDAFSRYRKAYRGTTHISVVDDDGNAASTTVSNGEGCGTILTDAGFMPNNMLGEEDINPEGIGRWPLATRMASMMAPTLIEHQNGGLTALGSGGSNRIRSAILQVIVNLLDYDMSLEQAICAPRIHREKTTLNVENLFGESEIDFSSLADELTLWPDRNMFFGGVHTVQRTTQGDLIAHGDPRRAGHAGVAGE